MSYEFDTTVLGGLPVTVEYDVARAEPDVGIPYSYVDDANIVAVNGRVCKKPPFWIYARLEAKGEEHVLIEAANEHYCG